MMKQLLSLFILLMQSYVDFGLIPRKFVKSSPTCVDKRSKLGQIEEKDSIIVYNMQLSLYYFVYFQFSSYFCTQNFFSTCQYLVGYLDRNQRKRGLKSLDLQN